MFSRKICEIFKNTYFKEHLRTTASSDIYHNKQLKNDSYPGLTDLKQWCIHFIFVFQENLSITESFWRIFSISCSIYLLINLWVNILWTFIYLFIYLFGEWRMTYNCFNPNLGWEGIFVKKFDETSFWQIMASLSFFRFTNLQLSGSRIADACSVKLTFSHGNLSSYKNWKQNLNISNSALIL